MGLVWVSAVLILAMSGCCPPKDPETTGQDRKAEPGASLRAAPGTEHDRHFRKWGRTFFSRQVDWRWFKAQGAAESGLCPDAVSPAGAKGMMQLMPATSREMSARLGVENRPLDPELSIMMGIAYDRRLWDEWTAPRPRLERLKFTFASYNAGLGHILRAQELAGSDCDPSLWPCVALYLPRVTGDKARETLDYILRIEKVFREYGGEGR